VVIDTTRPELLAAAWRSSPTPTTSATSRCSAPPSRTPLFGVEVPVVAHHARRSREGHRHRHDLHVRRPHRRHLVARAAAADPRRSSAATAASSPTRPSGSPTRPAGRLRAARRQEPQAAQKKHGRAAAASGEMLGDPARSPPGEVLREGRQAARDRHHPPVVHPQRRPRRRPARGAGGARRELTWHPTLHARALRELGRGASTATGSSAGSASSACRSRCGTRSTPTATPTTTPLVPDEASAADRPAAPTCPPGYTADQRGVPGGFIGDPDIMDTWATSSLTPQIAARMGDDPDLFERTFPMDLRPQGHDIIRTWLFSTWSAATWSTTRARGANAALSGWILDPDRKKMSKSKGNVVTPMGTAREYGSDAVRYWAASAARHRHRVRRGPDEDRPQAGDQAAQRLASSCSASAADPDAAVTEPIDRAMLADLAASSTTPPRRSTASTTPARSSAPRTSSGGSATTTSSW
jgi:valyl-tRNA synthetase